MNVSQIMQPKVWTCRPDDTLLSVAKLLWEGDCGCAPVIDSDGRVIGMITDRDIAMSEYLSGRPFASSKVADAMSKTVHACRPDDSLYAAEQSMRSNRVRRLPVIDADGLLVGILSLNDIARAFEREPSIGMQAVEARQLAETLASICKPRAQEHAAVAA